MAEILSRLKIPRSLGRATLFLASARRGGQGGYLSVGRLLYKILAQRSAMLLVLMLGRPSLSLDHGVRREMFAVLSNFRQACHCITQSWSTMLRRRYATDEALRYAYQALLSFQRFLVGLRRWSGQGATWVFGAKILVPRTLPQR